MTKARDLANLLDANGDVKSASLDNVPAVDLTTLSASNLTSGTVADARLPATALNSNVDLTTLSASNLTSGTLADARFPSTLPAVSGANLTNLSGGDYVLLATATASSSSVVELDNVFSATDDYKSYHVRFQNVNPSGDGYFLIGVINADGSVLNSSVYTSMEWGMYMQGSTVGTNSRSGVGLNN